MVVHGDGSGLLVLDGGSWKSLSPEALAERMRAQGFDGGAVRLISCGTGQADGAAARLARELGVDVKAPTDTVWIHPDGTLTVGPTPDASSGGWSRTAPDGASEFVEDSARLSDEALERVNGAVPVSAEKWHAGSFDSPEASLQSHFEKHGAEVGAATIEQYLRKATAFAQNLRGARRTVVHGATDGVTRYVKNGKYIDLAPDGCIVSFGRT